MAFIKRSGNASDSPSSADRTAEGRDYTGRVGGLVVVLVDVVLRVVLVVPVVRRAAFVGAGPLRVRVLVVVVRLDGREGRVLAAFRLA